MNLAIHGLGRAGAAKDIGTRIGGLMQDPHHIVVLNWSPGAFSLMGSTVNPPRKEQVVLVKMANRRTGRASVLKAAKDLTNARLHLARSDPAQ